ncbi:hypothetical protein ARMSODRAFT_193340 [Armillaria solidipes]|uniref:DUF6534 domain-containing protein n=1 Tax=Armillaria solidipes TaxID=1076256 RepID=A0A2H3BY22_9AGAR|nr:hypothetical protein ARMSODRAFT_193340 [Armillaria solidipes]
MVLVLVLLPAQGLNQERPGPQPCAVATMKRNNAFKERRSELVCPSLMLCIQYDSEIPSPVINGEDPHDNKNAAISLSLLSYFQMAEASLNGTFGAFLIGIIVSSCLFGVACTQTWYYYTRYSDGIVLKALVGTILILEVLHLAFSSHAIYYYVVLHYGDPAALAKGTWSIPLNVGTTSLIASLVHLFYARRIYYLSNHNIPLVAAVIIPSICSWGASMFVTVYSMHLKFFVLFNRTSMASLIRACLTLYVVMDLLVAVLLCYFLHSSRTGIKRTDTLINRLIVYAVHNGLITSVADIFVLAFNIAYPKNLVCLSVHQIVAPDSCKLVFELLPCYVECPQTY